jgi:bile acid:Na+ symporter, BASS family
MGIQFVDILVSLVLGLVMFGVGLSLTAIEFKHILRHPKELAVALTSQMVALPIIAWILTLLRPDLPPEIRTGFIILAASPGGATSGLITYLFKGNVALSLSLTTVNSFLTLFSIPVIVNLALNYYMGQQSDLHLPFWETVLQIFSITLIPASLGVTLRHNKAEWAKKIERPMRFIMLGLLLVVFIIKIFASENQGGTALSAHDFMTVLPHALLQNICCLFFGFFALKFIGSAQPSRITAAIESGVQNTTLSFLIAGTLIGNQQMVIPPLIYSMFSFVTACIFCYSANKMAGIDPPVKL